MSQSQLMLLVEPPLCSQCAFKETESLSRAVRRVNTELKARSLMSGDLQERT